MMQRTLVMVKPDAVRRKQVGEVIRRFEAAGLTIRALKMVSLERRDAEGFYQVHRERPFFVSQFLKAIPGYAERFKAKPGLTGLAQVSGSYATTPANKLKYDLIYIYHQSFFLDLKIIFSTIRVVLTASGSR